MDNDNVYWECGPGWGEIIRPLIDKANELGAIVDQVKEKYGELRFYYTPTNGEMTHETLDDMIDEAEDASQLTCEMCGNPGRTRVRHHWYKTLCNEHALDQGYP
jgi:hypothetical protein